MYILKITSNIEEFIAIDDQLLEYRKANDFSELQYIDSSEIKVGISLDGGINIPDILSKNNIIFISSKFKQGLDKYNIDYLFYKKTKIVCEELGIDELFYMVIPPRVDCLKLSCLDDKTFTCENGLIPLIELDEFSINEDYIGEDYIGRYQIFKIFGLLNNNIYVTDEFCEYVKSLNITGLIFFRLD